MRPQFVTKPAFTVIGLKIRTTPMSPEIPQLWGEFAPRIDEVQHTTEPNVSYGLMGHYDQVVGTFDYMAGVSVEQVANLPAGMAAWDVPASTYAVFDATLSTIGAVFGHIYNSWLATSDYQQTTDLNFERYGETFNPDDPNSTMSIYVPVQKKI